MQQGNAAPWWISFLSRWRHSDSYMPGISQRSPDLAICRSADSLMTGNPFAFVIFLGPLLPSGVTCDLYAMVMGSPQKIAGQNATHSTEWNATSKNIQ